jgi:hypothetical protein
MRVKIFNAAYLGSILIATGGWIWLLYAGLKWIIEI